MCRSGNERSLRRNRLVEMKLPSEVEAQQTVAFILEHLSGGFPRSRTQTPILQVGMVESIFHNTMNRYPMKLGYVFHRNVFRLACAQLGVETVGQLIHETIAKALEAEAQTSCDNQPTITLESLVVEAATDWEISLDGLYALVRSDPGKLMPK